MAGLLLFASWYAQRLVGTASTRAAVARIPTNIVVSVVALALWSTLSVTWAESSGAAVTATISFLLNMLLLPIVMVAVRRREHLYWVLAAFLIGAIISTAYGFVSGATQGRLEGGIGDANEQAAVLVAAIPIALALGNAMRRPGLRLLCWGGRRVLPHRRLHHPVARRPHRPRMRDGGRRGRSGGGGAGRPRRCWR